MIKASHQRTQKSDENDSGMLRWSEFGSDEVFRRVALPLPIDVSKITANFKNGLLVVVAPQAPSPPAPTSIAITQGS